MCKIVDPFDEALRTVGCFLKCLHSLVPPPHMSEAIRVVVESQGQIWPKQLWLVLSLGSAKFDGFLHNPERLFIFAYHRHATPKAETSPGPNAMAESAKRSRRGLDAPVYYRTCEGCPRSPRLRGVHGSRASWAVVMSDFVLQRNRRSPIVSLTTSASSKLGLLRLW